MNIPSSLRAKLCAALGMTVVSTAAWAGDEKLQTTEKSAVKKEAAKTTLKAEKRCKGKFLGATAVKKTGHSEAKQPVVCTPDTKAQPPIRRSSVPCVACGMG